jgi:hypothetical protein
VKGPITFVYGNCVYARGLSDAWAAFAIDTASYAWLDAEGKRSRFLALVAALSSLDADVQLLRVAADVRSTTGGPRGGEEAAAGPQERRRPAATPAAAPHARQLRDYLAAEDERLRELPAFEPALYAFVSLRDAVRDVASYISRAAGSRARDIFAEARAALMRDRRMLTLAELEHGRMRADRVHARLLDHLPARPARSTELQWLIRRAFCRGLGEPLIDGLHEPSALLFEHNGDAVLAPLECDVVRWEAGCVDERRRLLAIDSELGRSWQAHLALGALPQQVTFPGPQAELMFAPPESLDFGVDIALAARYVPNELALRLTRRRIQDADQIARAEADGDQGVTDLGFERTQDARDLLAYLQSSGRPPLLRAAISIAIAAADERVLEERVELCRRAFGEVRLHRPVGDQGRLFVQSLPAQRPQVAGYDDLLTTEQVAAMVPSAAHAAGSKRGFYLGHSLSGSRQPIRLDLREGSDSDRNTTILSVGALGSGKSTLAQKLAYEGFLLGARVVDCDPKGDHRMHLLEQVAPHVECVTLRPDRGLRGVLDPLRVAPAHLRQEVTVSFLRELLPARAEAAWETAVLAAVERVIARCATPSCGEVVRALSEAGEVERAVADTLAIYARSGLTQLGFADPDVKLPRVGERQVTYLPIRDLPAPDPNTRRAEYTQAERVGVQIVRLIAMFAAHLMGSERSRLKLFSFDEGWRLLSDPAGRALLGHVQRMGRSELAVPIISTQLVTDAVARDRESLENLIGATFVFGMRSEPEAGRALSLLGLDPDDVALRRAVLAMEAGRCLFRDHRGRVEAIQVEVVIPALLRALSTTPQRA